MHIFVPPCSVVKHSVEKDNFEFLNLGNSDIGSHRILCWGRYITGIQTLDISSSSPLPSCGNQKMSSDIATCPREDDCLQMGTVFLGL